jgi:hypothetical protein
VKTLVGSITVQVVNFVASRAATREWTQLHFPKDKAPPERHSMSYVLYKDTMVMFGGIGPSGTKSAELITYNLRAF